MTDRDDTDLPAPDGAAGDGGAALFAMFDEVDEVGGVEWPMDEPDLSPVQAAFRRHLRALSPTWRSMGIGRGDVFLGYHDRRLWATFGTADHHRVHLGYHRIEVTDAEWVGAKVHSCSPDEVRLEDAHPVDLVGGPLADAADGHEEADEGEDTGFEGSDPGAGAGGSAGSGVWFPVLDEAAGYLHDEGRLRAAVVFADREVDAAYAALRVDVTDAGWSAEWVNPFAFHAPTFWGADPLGETIGTMADLETGVAEAVAWLTAELRRPVVRRLWRTSGQITDCWWDVDDGVMEASISYPPCDALAPETAEGTSRIRRGLPLPGGRARGRPRARMVAPHLRVGPGRHGHALGCGKQRRQDPLAQRCGQPGRVRGRGHARVHRPGRRMPEQRGAGGGPLCRGVG